MNKYNIKFGQQLAVMVYAQIAQPSGLRSLVNSLNMSGSCLYHLGIPREVRHSTVSYANGTRSPGIFERLFYEILCTIGRGGRKKFRRDFMRSTRLKSA